MISKKSQNLSKIKARYSPLPHLSPYISGNRYHLLKEDHKYYIRKLQSLVDTKQRFRVADVGCGNEEMIYALKRAFPQWDFTGYDKTREFIETAKAFEGLKGVRMIQSDLFDIEETFQIVLCSSVIQIFQEIEPPLLKLLSLCKKEGFLLIDGLFNKFDIEVRLQFCDNTNPISKGLWRADWNQHSQASIRRLLENKVEWLEFEEVPMDLDIPLNTEMPINRFTFRNQNGKNITTNGTNLMMDRILMTVKK